MLAGIYVIRNKVNGKAYVGKSKNILARFWSHKNNLKKKVRDKKQTNRYLWNAVQKDGLENFEFLIWQIFRDKRDLDSKLADAEIRVMDLLESCNPNYGYNLRRDSSTKTEVHEETRKLLSEISKGENNPNFGKRWTPEQRLRASELKKKEWADGVFASRQTQEFKEELARKFSALWKDPAKLMQMKEKVAIKNSHLKFYQYTKDGILVKEWTNMSEIIKAHPDYHKIAIYSVCNGHKKSYRGFIWKSEETIKE